MEVKLIWYKYLMDKRFILLTIQKINKLFLISSTRRKQISTVEALHHITCQLADAFYPKTYNKCYSTSI